MHFVNISRFYLKCHLQNLMVTAKNNVFWIHLHTSVNENNVHTPFSCILFLEESFGAI